ncbi:MAG: RNA polymerase sigma factor [FCB group bacterium]|jgi:RNA polymerase sigma-70 factor (ECF subfamily)
MDEMRNNYSTYPDDKLVVLLRGGNSESELAFTEIYNRYSSRVHAYCMRVMNHKEYAEDIFQETFIRFFQKVKTDYNQTNIPGFLITIARNLCLNFRRDNIPTVPLESDDFLVDSNRSYEDTELLDLITASLDLLEFEYKEAFVLREYDGMTYNQIADICGITVTNAKSRVFRAKQKIKEILNPYLKDLAK